MIQKLADSIAAAFSGLSDVQPCKVSQPVEPRFTDAELHVLERLSDGKFSNLSGTAGFSLADRVIAEELYFKGLLYRYRFDGWPDNFFCYQITQRGLAALAGEGR